MKKTILSFLAFLLAFCMLSCSFKESESPSVLFEKIERSYGKLSPGLFFDSEAKEWEERYLDPEVIEDLFGDEKSYKDAVESASLYLSSSLDFYEEIFVFKCYSSDKARKMAGIVSERNRALSLLEEEPLEAEICCSGRTLVYCRLKNAKRAKEATHFLN